MAIVFIHDNADTREMVTFAVESKLGVQVKKVSTVNEALDFLLEDKSIEMIVCTKHESNVKLFKYLLSCETRIPCVLIEDKDVKEIELFPDLKVLATLQEHELVDELPRLVEANLKDGQERATEMAAGFCRIKTELLVRVMPLQGDVYIRLSDIKFVKMFRKGTFFRSDDAERFIFNKKADYLYLRKTDAGEFVSKFKNDLLSMLEKGLPDGQDRAEFLLSIQDTVTELAQRFGLTPDIQEMIKANVDLSIKEIQHEFRKDPNFTKFLETMMLNQDKYISAHSMMLAHIACGLASKLGWPSEQTFRKLTMAAYLHDITLNNESLASIESMQELEIKKDWFSPQEVNDFKNHCTAANDLIKKFQDLPPDVDTIILEHHEKPDGTGFPRALTAHSIAPLAAVFIVAHDLVHEAFANKMVLDLEKFKQDRKDTYTGSNFGKALAAL